MVNKQEMNQLEDKLRAEYESKINNLKEEMDSKISSIENYTKGQVEALQQIIARKDSDIADLNKSVGGLIAKVKSLEKNSSDLMESNNFISAETSQLKGQIKDNNFMIDTSRKNILKVEDKARDLEDRQRRNNLVFFKIPESTRGERENCEKLVVDELMRCGIISEEERDDSQYLMDRAHRLGKRDDRKPHPRPIIVRMTMFKDKQHILKNGYKLSGSHMNVSEDYSKATLELHSDLVKAAKTAKEDPDSQIKSFRVMYRRVSLKFENPANNEVQYRSFSMININDHPNDWYKGK